MKVKLYKVGFSVGTIGWDPWTSFYIVLNENEMLYSLDTTRPRLVKFGKGDIELVKWLLKEKMFLYTNAAKPSIPKFRDKFLEFVGGDYMDVYYGFELDEELLCEIVRPWKPWGLKR